MIRRTLQQVAHMVNQSQLLGDSTLTIQGVSINSRDDLIGKLFIPIKGERFNGHSFAREAFEKGAIGSLWSVSEPNPPENVPLIIVEDTLVALQELAKSYRNELNLKVVGITGSNGKTTTKDMVFSVLATTYKVQKTEGNYNNHFGLPLTILNTKDETELLVLEMGMSSRGEIELLSNLAEPDVAIITNIGESHLQDLGSREEIAEAKLEITAGLKKDGTLIYIGDEPLLQERIDRYDTIRLLSFGKGDTNDYYPTSIIQKEQGSEFSINKEKMPFYIPVFGSHNVFNALATIAASEVLRVPLEKVREGLSYLTLTKMRAELVSAKSGAIIINDAYNASPTSMKAAIQLLQDMEGYERRILVLGDMLELGDNEIQFHQETGETIDPNKISLLYTYGERGKWIAEGAKKNLAHDAVFSFTDKNELISCLKGLLKKEDILLFKASRGMKLEEIVEALKV